MPVRKLTVATALLLAGAAHAGPFAPAAGQPGSTAISASDPAFTAWATGYTGYAPGPGVDDIWKTPAKALGPAEGNAFDVVVLGDGGVITLTFGGQRIVNGPGADFAVFENSFSDTFLELAWVEVSSNGTDFFRFPGFSFTPAPVAGFGTIDPTDIDGFAGKYRQGFGTPFDLDMLATVPGLDVNNVGYVRIVDIIGNGSVVDNFPAEFGGPNPVYDPYPTTGTAGFDLDAVGVIHAAAVPEPSTVLSLFAGGAMLVAILRRRSARAGAFRNTVS